MTNTINQSSKKWASKKWASKKRASKKIPLLCSFVFAVTAFGSLAGAADYRGIRIFQSSEQFDLAVEADTVVVSLPQNLTLHRKRGSAEASRTIEKVLTMRDDEGRIAKELVVNCQMAKPTKKDKVVMQNTSGTANPWLVTSVKKLSPSKETWFLGRAKSEQIAMTCHSFERKPSTAFPGTFEVTEVSLTPTMVNRALSSVNGSVLAEVTEAELSNEKINDVISAPAPISESYEVGR
jgi:hypothetical protein